MALTQVTKENYQAEVADAGKLVLIDFYADWCGPCRQLGPVLESFAAENADKVKVVKVNVDENPELHQAFVASLAEAGVAARGIPLLVTVRGDDIVGTQLGAVPKSGLQKLVETSLERLGQNSPPPAAQNPTKPNSPKP